MNQTRDILSSATYGSTDLSLRPKPPAHRQAWRLIVHHPIGAVGALLILILIIVAVLAPVVAPYDPTAQLAKRLLPPSKEYLLGTDNLGRDILSRLIWAARISLYVGIIAVGLAFSIGIPIGVLSGYLGGNFDNLVMRLIDIMLAFPALVLAIVLAGLLGPSVTNAMIAIGIVYAPAFARVARGSVLSVKQEVYIEAARVVGGTPARILLKHIVPNILAPLIVLATLQLSTAILTEAGLSFLGLGTQPPTPSWGIMLSTGRQYMELAPGVTVFPGLAIAITVLAFNFLGDGLRDVLDPRLRQ